ncbi:hypothetical protein CGMCC3_g7925 [Colletotrichum fructicola]|nr:uncharacterized protein CGMCC3_g7925 [Colletotrichum fructicola]KAE9576271.1 hypothetical protein CGMCC3_g7925 [Colletotrichum fructicola]
MTSVFHLWKPSSCLQHAARRVNRLKQEVPDGDLLWSGGPLVVFLVVPLFPNQARQQQGLLSRVQSPRPARYQAISSDPELRELGPSNLGLDGAAGGTSAVAGTDDRFGYATRVRYLANSPARPANSTHTLHTHSAGLAEPGLYLSYAAAAALLHCCKSTATAMATSPATATVCPSCLSLHAAAAATTGHL